LQTLILLAGVAVMPTVWLRDMSLLSYLSVGGIFASVALLGLVGWEAVAITGFPHDQPPLVTWPGVPISIGLFCFCFSGEAVMATRSIEGLLPRITPRAPRLWASHPACKRVAACVVLLLLLQ
jgi:amino acid permease